MSLRIMRSSMKVYIESLGCPKNTYDSQVAAGILLENGYNLTEDPSEADYILVNTCGFIGDAKEESIEKLFEMWDIKKERAALISTGCLSARYSHELASEMPEIDILMGTSDYNKLPEILETYRTEMETKSGDGSMSRVYNTLCPREYVEQGPRWIGKGSYSLPIKISEGCDNTCSFCVIPSIRGKHRSRKMEDILAEAEELAEKGCKELIIVAQDVTVYGRDLYKRLALPELLEKLCKIQGLRWIRLMYCYEDNITDELIDVMAKEDKICNYIDIPIQHSSNSILKSMRRNSTRESLISTIGRLRGKIKDIHIRTTLITGYPGEKVPEFEDLLSFVEEVGFERLGVFSYSKEEGTRAATLKPQVRQDVKERRRDRILRAQIEISLKKNLEKVGKIMEVLVEGMEDDGTYYGRTRYDAPEIDNSVIFTSENSLAPGDFVFVSIVDGFDYDLVGKEVQ